MQGHMMLLADPMLTGEIENSIRNDGVNSEFAIENVCNMYADMFASMGRRTDAAESHGHARHQDPYAADAYGHPVRGYLLPAGRQHHSAKDLTPSMTAGINPANVTGIVTELGGRTSHSAILARALEIPAVVAVDRLYGRR